MNETERQAWNAAVAACEADPSPANITARDELKERILTGIHLKVMTEDGYQERTHA